jgi:hypothetical protein
MRSHPSRAVNKPAVVCGTSHLRPASFNQSLWRLFIASRARPTGSRDGLIAAGPPRETPQETLQL